MKENFEAAAKRCTFGDDADKDCAFVRGGIEVEDGDAVASVEGGEVAGGGLVSIRGGEDGVGLGNGSSHH